MFRRINMNMSQLGVFTHTRLLGPQQVGENSTKTLLYQEIKASRKQKIQFLKRNCGAHSNFEK